MSDMNEMLLLAGALVPEEYIVREIKKYAEQYLAGDKNSLNKLTAACMILMAKGMTGDSVKGAMDGIKRLKEIEERDKLHTPTKS